jgi:parvulin-like peptidyl-prolyl isomerase
MTQPEFHLQEIEQPTEDALKELLREVNLGADFGEVAAEHTIREGYREKNGDLGFVTQYKYPALYRAAKNVGVGNISPMVRNARGNYSIVKLLDIKQPEVRPLEECEREVRQAIYRHKRTNATANWLEAKRAETEIEVFEEVLENSVDESKYEQG